MERLPFETVYVEAMQLFNKAIASPEEMQMAYFKEYSDYLRFVGWNDHDFDIELLKRVDQNWTDKERN
jgi:hypothetical protein